MVDQDDKPKAPSDEVVEQDKKDHQAPPKGDVESVKTDPNRAKAQPAVDQAEKKL